MADINGVWVFCDDVREETGGKASLIGLLGSEATVEDLPAMLSRFAAVFVGRIRGADKIKGRFTLEILGIDDPAIVPFTNEREFERETEADEWTLRVNLIGAVPVAEGSRVRATCVIDGFETSSEIVFRKHAPAA